MNTPGAARGFTLIESVIVMAITGVVAAVVAVFIAKPLQAYRETAARALLAEQADMALRRIGRDLRAALPNSVRVNAGLTALEFIPTQGGARYATEGSGALQFGNADTAFEVLGPALTLEAGSHLVFYNLGPGISGADAYAPIGSVAEQAGANRRAFSGGAGSASSITFASLAPLPAQAMAAPYRVTAVGSPVTYRCDLASGRLLRHQAYGFQAAQPDPPGSGSSAVLATGVTACRLAVDGTLVAARSALVNLALTLSTGGSAGAASVTLHHAIFVDNQP